jgi:hypothetical protein
VQQGSAQFLGSYTNHCCFVCAVAKHQTATTKFAQSEVGEWNGIHTSSGRDTGSGSIVNPRSKRCHEVHPHTALIRNFEHPISVLPDRIDQRLAALTARL